MVKFEVILAHSRPGKDSPRDLASEDQSETEIRSESIPLVDDNVSLASANRVTQEPHNDCPIAANLDIFSSLVGTSLQSPSTSQEYGTSSGAKNQMDAALGPPDDTFPAKSQCWVGIETATNLILPDRYVGYFLDSPSNKLIIWKPDGYSFYCI
jgi:hypothetical protein